MRPLNGARTVSRPRGSTLRSDRTRSCQGKKAATSARPPQRIRNRERFFFSPSFCHFSFPDFLRRGCGGERGLVEEADEGHGIERQGVGAQVLEDVASPVDGESQNEERGVGEGRRSEERQEPVASQSEDAPLEKLRCHGLDGQAARAPEDSSEAGERLPAKVLDAEVLGKHEIPIHLNQRVEVEKAPDAAHGGDDEERPRRERPRSDEPPPEDGERPDEELEEASGEKDPEAFALRAKEVGIAHVAVEAGQEVEEKRPHIRDPPAEVPAGERVSQLVESGDERDGEEDEEKSLEAHDALESERRAHRRSGRKSRRR